MDIKASQNIISEAARLRTFGYPWELAFKLAELMHELRERGYLAMVSEDVLPILEEREQ